MPLVSLNNGYHEAVAIVADARASAKRICSVLGYEELHRGAPASAALGSLGLAAERDWLEIVIAQPQCERGFLRFLSHGQKTSLPRRLGAQPWDIGGWFDVGMRSLVPLGDMLRDFSENEFTACAPIVEFNMGGVKVLEVLARDADSLCFAATERLDPPLEGYGHVEGPASNLFNSVITVPNLENAVSFFVGALEWTALVDTQLVHENGRNVMGMPPDLAREKPVKLAIVQQQGRMEGSVELIEYPCEGLDFTKDSADQRGIATMRFPVSDVAAVASKLSPTQAKVGDAITFECAPYGQIKAVRVVTPWGAAMQFFEIV